MAGDAYHLKQKQKLNKINKGLWSPEEDEKLFAYIIRFGVGSWTSVPHLAGLQRCGKSCRLRWVNYLRPGLKRGSFSQQEQDIILHLHQLLGNRWAQIAKKLPGRTDNEVKNFWNSHLKKTLIEKGVDPNTHQPVIVNEECNKNKTSFAYDQPHIVPMASSSSMALTPELNLQDNFHMDINDSLGTLEDDFITNNVLLDGSELGIEPVGSECNLVNQYQQMNCETEYPSIDFYDTLTSRIIMDKFIKEDSRGSSSCTNYSNMTNLSAETLMNTTEYEEWNAIKRQEMQEVQACSAGDSDTYPTGFLSENLHKSVLHQLIEFMNEDQEFSHTNSFQRVKDI